jgi:hypothetical protein
LRLSFWLYLSLRRAGAGLALFFDAVFLVFGIITKKQAAQDFKRKKPHSSDLHP